MDETKRREASAGLSGSSKDLTRKTANGLVWTLLGNIGKSIAQLIPIALMARLVSPSDFGVMTAAFVIISLAEQIAYSGFGPTIVQLPTLRRDHIGSAYALSFVSGLVIAGALIVGAPWIADLMSLPGLKSVVPLIAFAFPISAAAVISARLLQRQLDFRFQVQADLGSYLIGYYLVGLPMAWFGFGINALVAAFLVQVVIRSLLLFLRTLPTFNLSVSRSALAELYQSGAAVFIGGLATEFLNSADRIAVGHVSGAATLGVYGRAADLSQRAGRVLDQMVVRALFPAFAHRQGDPARLVPAFIHVSTLSVLLVGPFAIFLYTFAPQIIGIVFGAKWTEAIAPFQFLSLALIFQFLFRIFTLLIQGVGRFWMVTALQAGGVPLAVIGAIVVAPHGLIAVSAFMLGISVFRMAVAMLIASASLGVSWIRVFVGISRAAPVCLLFAASCWIATKFILEFPSNRVVELAEGAAISGILTAVSVLAVPRFFLTKSASWIIDSMNLSPKSKRVLAMFRIV